MVLKSLFSFLDLETLLLDSDISLEKKKSSIYIIYINIIIYKYYFYTYIDIICTYMGVLVFSEFGEWYFCFFC
jgi:hypothetical protein